MCGYTMIFLYLPHKLLFGIRTIFLPDIIERYVGSLDAVIGIGSSRKVTKNLVN